MDAIKLFVGIFKAASEGLFEPLHHFQQNRGSDSWDVIDCDGRVKGDRDLEVRQADIETDGVGGDKARTD